MHPFKIDWNKHPGYNSTMFISEPTDNMRTLLITVLLVSVLG